MWRREIYIRHQRRVLKAGPSEAGSAVVLERDASSFCIFFGQMGAKKKKKIINITSYRGPPCCCRWMFLLSPKGICLIWPDFLPRMCFWPSSFITFSSRVFLDLTRCDLWRLLSPNCEWFVKRQLLTDVVPSGENEASVASAKPVSCVNRQTQRSSGGKKLHNPNEPSSFALIFPCQSKAWACFL